MNTLTSFSLLLICLLMSACTGIPKGITPIKNFDIQRYLGDWYEISRLDHGFERGLSHVTASYTLREDGGIKVINRGYDKKKDAYKEATGKAYFIDNKTIGRLKVSFFGPFYGGYNIIALDHENYSWVMISGPSRKYLWILSRQPTLAPGIIKELVAKATEYGFPTDALIYVEQGRIEE